MRLHWAGEKTKLALLGCSPFSELTTLISRNFQDFVQKMPNDFKKKVKNYYLEQSKIIEKVSKIKNSYSKIDHKAKRKWKIYLS